ncbi:ABC transporter permease [candidate division KSB1 bacterium]|nr:ABC transporter permease [candidate division KSB1 bacterium]
MNLIKKLKPGSNPGKHAHPESKKLEEKFYLASQWKLMWWKFLDHKVAVFAGIILILFYFVALFCEMIAPYDPQHRDVHHIYAPPHEIHFIDDDGFHFRPFIYGYKLHVDQETLNRTYTEDKTRRIPIKFWVQGDGYELWGFWKWNRHLFGVNVDEKFYFLGADRMGRDMLSRIIYGSRISLSIGLVGVTMSLLLGIVLGGISGFYGGIIDNVMQRLIEILRSFPTIPLWLALSAALPAHWSQLKVYFGMTVILSFIGWTGLARVVRGKLLALREEDFAMAARVAGVREFRIIMKHLVPSFTSHLIVSVTLAIPGMILAETSLSFLRLGLRPPTISWGVLLQEAQNVRTVALHPWLLYPVLFVIVAVLMFNFLGDGLRDASDPYSK